MPSLIQQLALAQSQGSMRPTQRKRVVVYSPGRPVPGGQRQAVQPQRMAPRPSGSRPSRTESTARGDAIQAAKQEYFNSPEARKQREDALSKQAQQQAEDDLPWWKKGLGMVVGNPIVKTAMMPLGAIGTLRRGIDLGIEELAEHTNLEDLPTWAKVAMTVNPITMAPGIASWVDTERTEADKRSNWEKVFKPESDFGFGQLINPDLPGPVGGAIGLYGDIALDPTTYLTAGGSRIAQEGAKVGQEIVLHGGKAERLGILSKLSELPEEQIQRLAPDIQRAGARGLNSASPELREALNLVEPKVRFAGQAIPGSERLAVPFTRATGAARAGVNRLRVPQALARGPKGLESAVNVLTRYGAETDVPRALTQQRLTNLGRLATGETTTRSNRSLYNLVKKGFKGKSKAAIRQLTREAEEAPGRNAINEFFGEVIDIYQQTSGQNVAPYLLDPDHYVPHMLTPGFRRMLREQLDKGNPVARDFMDQAGFATDDLLEGSGYIEKSRKLTPNVDPITGTKTAAEIPIGGQKVTLKTGTLDELDQQLRKVFPGFTGDFYERDPVRIGEAYIQSLAKGAGQHAAVSQMADTGSTLVERIGGPAGRGPALGQALEEANAARNAQQPIMDTIRQGFEPGDVIPPVTPPTEVPEDVAGIHLPDFFDEEVNRKATEAQQSFFRNEGKQWTKEVRGEISDVRTQAAQDLGSLRDNWSKGLRDDLQGANKQIKVLDSRIQRYDEVLKAMGSHRAETHDELTKFLVGIRKDIDDLTEEMGKKTSYWKGRVTKATREAQAEMEQRLKQLRALERLAQDKAEKLPGKLGAELRDRVSKILEPARRAQQEIDEIKARLPGRPSDERLVEAKRVLSERKLETIDPHAALRDEYRDLLSKDPAKRTAREKARISELQAELGKGQREVTQLSEFDKDTQRLNEVIEQMEAGRVPAAAEPTPSPAQRRPVTIDKSKKRLDGTNTYSVWDGVDDYTIRKNDDGQWIVRTNGRADADNGYRTLKKAEEAINSGKHATVPPEVAAAAAPGAVDDATMAALRRERTTLQRRFQQGGKHAAERRARATMAENEAWEQAATTATSEPAKRLLEARRRQQLSMDSLSEQMGIEQSIKTAQQRAEVATSRAERMQRRVEAPFDLGRDLGGKVGAERAKGVEEVQKLSRQQEVARDLHDEVLDTTRTELRKVDADMAETQVSMVRDAQERQPLLAKRDEAKKMLDQLKKTERSLKTSGKGGVKYKPDEMLNVLDEIQSVARQNPNLDEATLTATESVLQAQRESLERVANNDITAKQAQALVDKSFKEGKDGLAPVMLTVLNDNWKMMYDGVLKQGDVIMDAELKRMFTNLYALDKEPKWLGRTFNALTNLFKTYATLTPGFHVRNALSGIFMNTADGVALKAQYEGAKYWQQYMKHGEEALKGWPADVREAFRAAAGSGAGGQFTEPGNYVQGNRLYNFLANNKATRSGILGKRGGERVEGALRLGMAIDTIKKGGTVEDALSRISRVHFDYSQVSRLDEQMKRVIPFWTFMSRNLPLQVTEMWTKPKTYAIYESALRNFGSEPEEYTPQYWLDAGGVNTGINVPGVPGLQQGGTAFFAPDLGYTRMQGDIQNVEDALQGNFGGILSAGNPWMTAPVEFATKHDFFTDQSYGPEDNVYADPITTFLGGLIGQTNEAGQVSIPFQNLLRSVNPAMDRMIRTLPTVAGGTDKDKSRQLESYARLLGVPARVLTPNAQDSEYWRRYYEIADEQERLKKMYELQAKQAG